MEAGLLVLLSATVARGLLASAFALVNERRLCSSRASTSGSSRCRTDDLLHAPRGPARRGIESSPARAASITCAWSRRGSRSRCPVRSLAWAGGRSSVTLQRLHLAASHEELAAVFLDGARHLLSVLLEPCRIGHFVVDDEICRHASISSKGERMTG